MNIIIPLHCECLIDQHRFIGNDPVGHLCYNSGVVVHSSGAVVCHECLLALACGHGSVELPRVILGVDGQKNAIHDAVINLIRNRDVI